MSETCDCCDGTTQITPVTIANRPGLNALAYRVGTHGAFLETMKARLSNFYLDIQRETRDAQGQPQSERIYPLQSLTTRAADDPSIALLDAWAIIGDVLTFYQERIANEGYLRTATERRSILEIARLVGYALRPGVAATVYLAYTLESTFKDEVIIPAGARAQSVPGPGELPQSFETSEPLAARASWNVLKPRVTRPQTQQTISDGTRVYLKGSSSNLKPNDLLLIDAGMANGPAPWRVMDVQPDSAADRTLVMIERWAAGTPAVSVETFKEIIKRVGETSALGKSARSEMVGRVRERLDELEAKLSAGASDAEAAAAIESETLPRLREELQVAEADRKYARIQPWLRRVVDVLGAATEQSLPRVAADRALGTAPAAQAGDFSTVLQKLVLSGSIPPANALRLRRDITETFALKADTGLQVATSFQPMLGATLAMAVANTKATPDVGIKVYALRVKAAPFGNNAPLQPVLDNGKIVSYQEWTLSKIAGFTPETFAIEVRVADRTVEGMSFNAKITIGKEFISDSRTLNNKQPFNIDFKVANEVIEVTPLTQTFSFRFVFGNRGITVTMSIDDNGNLIATSEGSDPTQVVVLTPPPIVIGLNVAAPAAVNAAATFASVIVGGTINIPSALATEKPNIISLDALYDQILPGSWVVVDRPHAFDDIEKLVITRALYVSQGSRADYGISAKGTQLGLKDPWLTGDVGTESYDVVRNTTVFAKSEELLLAEEPIAEDICQGKGADIELDGMYSGLQAGRWLIISGERTDIKDANDQIVSGIQASELVMLAAVEHRVQQAESRADRDEAAHTIDLPGDKTHTFIRLSDNLAYCYKRDAVTIYGNVVKATHGETRNEVLGSGDASQALQSFTLRQPPLTFVAAPNPRGVNSTLLVRVDDIAWHERDTLADAQPADRRFITRTDDDDKTTVIFGNGQQGARPPTGVENIKAVYRSGIGKPGNVKAAQIRLLATRPLGVKEVINPLRASGGADRESRDQARKNAPLAVLALDRLVSTQDYEDFARTFAGIGKASAARLSDGRRQVVFVTIAGAEDIPIDKSSDLYRNLVKALRQFGDPYQPVQVELRELLLLVISANVRILPDYLWEAVAPKIRARLLDTFSFERRELAQDVVLSEVISAIQAIEGVAYVDVDLLSGIPEKKTDEQDPGLRRMLTPDEIIASIIGPLGAARAKASNSAIKKPLRRLTANPADFEEAGVIRPAQLAFLTPDVPATLILNEIT